MNGMEYTGRNLKGVWAMDGIQPMTLRLSAVSIVIHFIQPSFQDHHRFAGIRMLVDGYDSTRQQCVHHALRRVGSAVAQVKMHPLPWRSISLGEQVIYQLIIYLHLMQYSNKKQPIKLKVPNTSLISIIPLFLPPSWHCRILDSRLTLTHVVVKSLKYLRAQQHQSDQVA